MAIKDGYEYRAFVKSHKGQHNIDISFYVNRELIEDLITAVDTYRRINYNVVIQRRKSIPWEEVDFVGEAELEGVMNDPRM